MRSGEGSHGWTLWHFEGGIGVPGLRQVADVFTRRSASSELIMKVLEAGLLKKVLDGVEL